MSRLSSPFSLKMKPICVDNPTPCKLLEPRQWLELRICNSRQGSDCAGGDLLQKIFGEVWTQESVENADKLMIALRGMKPSKEVGIPYSPYDQAKLVALLKAPKAAGMVYSFWFPGAIAGAQGAHSIAFFRNVEGKKGKMVPMDQNVLAFDPNFGECHIAEANLGKWLDALKKIYSGAINQQWLKYIEPNK